ncbi:hypothetical protein M405DRAFT_918982, partial [Rhizopogon salebrosus TDB-379]
ADNNIVYSAGVGTVVFSPVVDGKTVRAVEFTRVLHVPDLRNNLLSVLYLTHNIGFRTKENFGRVILNLCQASNICLFHDRLMTSKENSSKYVLDEGIEGKGKLSQVYSNLKKLIDNIAAKLKSIKK